MADQKLVEDISVAHLIELDAARQTLEKIQTPAIRAYAEAIVNEHTHAFHSLQHFAAAHNIALPNAVSARQRSISEALAKLNGVAFERQFIDVIGISEHRRNLDLFRDTRWRARDPDLRAYAASMLPAIERHLALATQLRLLIPPYPSRNQALLPNALR
jgi:putative membrane protein